MNFEELQEALEDIFELNDFDPSKIKISFAKNTGELVIYTGLHQDNNGELAEMEGEEEEEEEDPDFDDSFEPFIEDEEDEEDE